MHLVQKNALTTHRNLMVIEDLRATDDIIFTAIHISNKWITFSDHISQMNLAQILTEILKSTEEYVKNQPKSQAEYWFNFCLLFTHAEMLIKIVTKDDSLVIQSWHFRHTLAKQQYFLSKRCNITVVTYDAGQKVQIDN